MWKERLESFQKYFFLILRICVAIFLSFYFIKKLWHKCNIETNDIFFIAVLIFLVFSNDFSEFRIGDFISLKRDVEDNKKAIDFIRNQIVTIASNNNSFNLNQTFVNDRANRLDEENGSNSDIKSNISATKKTQSKRMTLSLEEECLKLYALENKINMEEIDVSRRITFSNGRSLVCDGVYKKGNEDIFLEIRSIDSVIRNQEIMLNYINMIEDYNRLGMRKAFLHCLVYYGKDSRKNLHDNIDIIKTKYAGVSQYLKFDFYSLEKNEK